MGGGGIIRTVNKADAAETSAGRRPPWSLCTGQHSAYGVGRNIAAIATSPAEKISSRDVAQISMQRPAWELEDGEFAGGDGDRSRPELSGG